ncbi:MAG: universal stress protein [Bacteroidota bacterium]|nr:universal stress protein [Bacteroidota bacterium]MDX5431232.1 universal stress protein [Bacteroidota bacterium]MDX5469971.1 universal stress protein [Bacteroidota bacterium]
MKKILALVDFTPITEKVIQQSVILAKQNNAALCLCHFIHGDTPKAEMEQKLAAYQQQLKSEGIVSETLCSEGNLYQDIDEVALRFMADLVIVGTHGKVGLRQNLFGSNIWKLVNAIPCSTLIISDATKINPQGFQKILMPLGPHPSFNKKAIFTSQLLAPGGTIQIFAIQKPGVPIGTDMLKISADTQRVYSDEQIKNSYVEIESSHFSVGYSRDTLEYAKNENYDAISILTEVSEVNAHFGQIDKENLVVNELGIPILCVR